MDMYGTEGEEISHLEAGARDLRAAANKALFFAKEQAREHERAAALRLVAESLTAAEKLDGYASHLRMFGRDYCVSDYAEEVLGE